MLYRLTSSAMFSAPLLAPRADELLNQSYCITKPDCEVGTFSTVKRPLTAMVRRGANMTEMAVAMTAGCL